MNSGTNSAERLIDGNALNSLFKPFDKESINLDLLDDELVMEIIVESECSKSKNESCVNSDCDYNLIDLHKDELYLSFVNSGDVNE